MGTCLCSRSGSSRCLAVGVSAAMAIAALSAYPAPPSSSSVSIEDRPRFTVGVLRRDGLLLPFASFDGDDWSSPWPDPAQASTLPIALDDVPKKWWGAAGAGASWTAWLGDGETRPLKLIAPIAIPVFCSTRLAVTTSYRGAPFDRGEPTAPKDGVAIGGDAATLFPISTVSVSSADAREVVQLITDDFNREEKVAAARFTRWKHPFSEDQRRQFPIELEAFYRASDTTRRGAWTTTYLEAVRKFPPGPKDEDCGLISFARAWVRQRQDAKPDIDVGVRIAYCDRADIAFMQPFGRLVLGDEVYWIYQSSSWRDELYTVARMRPTDVKPVVAVSGGFCEQPR
jgi:hypothetical protein